MPNPPRLYRELTPLRHVRRFTRMPCIYPQNVAEHSYYVALLASQYVAQVWPLLAVHGEEGQLRRGWVVEAALWHDAEEAVMGDIPHDVKRTTTAFHAAVSEVDRSARAYLEQFVDIHPWANLTPLEQFVIKLADCVELICYEAMERRAGNRALSLAQFRIWDILRGTMAKQVTMFTPNLRPWYEEAMRQLDETVNKEDYREGEGWPIKRT